MRLVYNFIDFSDKKFKDIISLRREVFCGEVGEKPAYAKSELDEAAKHVAYSINGVVIGCGSVAHLGNGEYEIYKIAVKKNYRKFNLGEKIFDLLKAFALENNAKKIVA